jgi:LacI family transcriptional regulator
MVTVYDIAKAAGVSYSTATRVLNGKANYTRPTYVKQAQRIRAIAEQMGYRPNTAARATSSGRFQAIGVLIRRLEKISFGPHPSYIRGLCKALDESNQSLIYAPVSPGEVTGPEPPRVLYERMVDGLIVGNNDLLDDQADAALAAARLPTVWLNSKREVNAVFPDDLQGGETVTRHLLERGHRKIAFVGNPDSGHYSSTDRVAGYSKAMRSAGGQALPVVWDIDPRKRLAKVEALLARPDRPTGIVVVDTDHESVLIAAAKLGLDIPSDLSIVGLGHGQPLNSYRVDTYEIPAYWVGYHAVKMLNQRIEDESRPDQPIRAVPYDKLLPGETVAEYSVS